MAQSYANTNGAGNRTGTITVTTTATLGGGTINNLVDGATVNNTTDSCWFNSGQSSREVKFDFGSGVVIDEAFWFQDLQSTHGSWKWQGSNDDSIYTDIGTTFTLGGGGTASSVAANACQRHLTLHGNVTSYRYYKLLQTAGTTSSSPWLNEIQFRINGTGAGTQDYSNGGYGDRTSLITVTTTATLQQGTIDNLVDGGFNNDSSDSFRFNGAQSSKEIKFDFGSARIIDEATWDQDDNSSSHGTWKWQGSTNDSSYADIGSTFTLGGVGYVQFHTQLHGNTTAYQYYKLLQTSGSTSGNPLFQREIEFRINLSSVTGTLTATETGDTAAYTGTVAWNAALATTETNDTAALTGSVTNNITGTFAATEANDDLQFDFQLQVQLDATETNDAASLAGNVAWTGTLATTEDADTGALTGQVTTQPTGTLAATEQKDTAALAGYVAIAGTLGAIEASDTAAFNGQGLPVTGTLAATEAPDILVFSQPDVYSVAMVAIEDADTAAFVGKIKRHPNVVVIVCNN